MKTRTPKTSNVGRVVQNFFLESDLGSTEPLLVNGLQFDQDGNLLAGQLVNPDAPALNEYLRGTMFGQYGIIAGGNLSGLLDIYAIQHNMFKHASVNQGKPPQQWNFNKLGVTERFLQTFRQYIPAGKEYDINYRSIGEHESEFSLSDIVKNIQNDKRSRYPINYNFDYEDYLSTVARRINSVKYSNVNNLRTYLKHNNLPELSEYIKENSSFE